MTGRFLSMALVLAFVLAGCLADPEAAGDGDGAARGSDDDGASEGAWQASEAAVFDVPAKISGFEEVAVIATPAGGNGQWIDRDRNVLIQSMGSGGIYIVDVADPADPVFLSNVSNVHARDVDLLVWQDRYIAVLAGAGEGIHLVDITDPRTPEYVSGVSVPVGAHNIAVVPGTPYVYNSAGGGLIYVMDATNLDDPKLSNFSIPADMGGIPVTSDGCHDVTVRPDLGLAFCAGGGSRYGEGGGETFIWDISEDPLDPDWIGMIDNPYVVYHHQAIANKAGNVLAIDDEFIAPNCARHDTPAGPAQTPTAAVWFYDISDPTNPVQLSYVQPPTPEVPAANCGSHFGDIVDDRDVLAMGFYGGGTVLIDFEDPAEPVLLEVYPAIGSTWDVRYHNGHFFTGSGDVQVLKLV